MKEFIEKLIERLEEEKCTKAELNTYDEEDMGKMIFRNNGLDKAKEIVNQLAEEYYNDKVNQIAMMYAKSISKYGVDIGAKWETATQQSMALSQAYMRGRQDEKDRVAKWQDEHNNGWIPVSERLPEDYQEVLVWFEYYRYGDYNGLYQTYGISYAHNGKWSGFVNGESGWHNLRIIAWMPLQEPYTENEV